MEAFTLYVQSYANWLLTLTDTLTPDHNIAKICMKQFF